MKLVGNASCFSNPQQQHHWTFGFLVCQAFAEVEAYSNNEGINILVVPALIKGLETLFGDTDCLATAEQKLKAHKQRKYNMIYKVQF
jgi:hypothetical protein